MSWDGNVANSMAVRILIDSGYKPLYDIDKGITNEGVDMAGYLRGCIVCGAPLKEYPDARELTCELCGKTFSANMECENGHYVCDDCHRSGAVESVYDLVKDCTSTDPVEILNILMDQPETHANGPEHHQLVGCAMATAYANAGGNIDLEKTIAEIIKRGGQLPGGTCGLWGTCGAASSCGIFLSVVLSQTPLHGTHYSDVNRQVSRALNAIAEIGGPRCCKRNGYLSLMQSVAYTNAVTGSHMTLPEHITCHYSQNNKQCLHENCPFFPGSVRLAPAADVTQIGTPEVMFAE